MFQTVDVSSRRHTWIAGDVHGCLDLLTGAFRAAQFDPAQDTLILVGDVLNRGPKSAATVKFLDTLSRDYDCVHSVRGNHEDRIIKAFNKSSGALDHKYMTEEQEANIAWFDKLDKGDRQETMDYITSLPLALEINYADGSKEGVVHADFPLEHSWSSLKDTLNADNVDPTLITKLTEGWGIYNSKTPVYVEGVQRLWVGHTPTRFNFSNRDNDNLAYPIKIRGNCTIIDSGAFLYSDSQYDPWSMAGLTLVQGRTSLSALQAAVPCQNGFRVVWNPNTLVPTPSPIYAL